MKYRSEVDGLRAVAVLPVILYHAGLSAFEGGYLGVDVFFVISGYLITSILYDEMTGGKFSIARFYERRARRILPVQYFIMLLCLPLGYFLMLPGDLENFGQSLVATVFFSNNFLLYLTSGYWVMEVDFKPLMHTWSLGVEEQYYFIVPILMLLALRLGKRPLGIGLILIFVLSLGFCQYMANASPSFNFLMLFTRAWELVAGGFVALFFRMQIPAPFGEKNKAFLAALGVILLIGSLVTFDHETKHPSILTLLPVGATMLILMFASPNNLVGKLLSGKTIVLLGLTSYGSYLWHQPIFAFARLVSMEPPSVGMMLLLSLLAIILAILSWKYVEAPFRGKDGVRLSLFIPAMVVSSLVLAGVGGYWHVKAGFSQSTPEVSIEGTDNPLTYHQYNMAAWRFAKEEFHDNGRRNVLVVGNSFARDFINAAVENDYLTSFNLVYRETIARHGEDSSQFLENEKHLLENTDVIIFGSGIADQIMATIEKMQLISDAEVIVIGPKNFGWNNNAVMRLPADERYEYRAKPLPEALGHEDTMSEIIPEEIYVSLFDLLSDDQGRVPVFTPERKFISQDRRHFTQPGAKYVGEILFEHPLLAPLR